MSSPRPRHYPITKLAAYVFDNTALVLITDYLTNQNQRVKLGLNFSACPEILRVTPQRSILRPILFNLFINDLKFFVKETEVCNFADDITTYSCSLNYGEAHRKPSNDTHIVLNWFQINGMVTNTGKFQMFLGSFKNDSNIPFIVENKHIRNTNEEKLLRITIDHKLTFYKTHKQFML